MYQTHKQFYDTISSHQNNKMVQKYAILLRTLHDSQTFRTSVNTCINYAHSHSHYTISLNNNYVFMPPTQGHLSSYWILYLLVYMSVVHVLSPVHMR